MMPGSTAGFSMLDRLLRAYGCGLRLWGDAGGRITEPYMGFH